MNKGLTYDELFPGRFIKAGEFGDRDHVTMTIKRVYLDSLEDERGVNQKQAVIALEETEREWALNKTNAQCLKAMWGDDSGEWEGKRVSLVAEPDASGLSDSGLCIRVKGSPDIKADMTVAIKLPRRKPRDRKLIKTKNGDSAHIEDGTMAPPDAVMATCTKCGAAVNLAPDVLPEDVAGMFCAGCGEQAMQIGYEG